MNEPYTLIPNRLIRSKLLNVYDKMIFCLISSYRPSFISYEKIAQILGISDDQVWKSIRKLKEMNIIQVSKKGRSNLYSTHWTTPYSGVIEDEPPRTAGHITPYSGVQPPRTAGSKKNNEKEQIKKSENKISDEIGKELKFFELQELIERNRDSFEGRTPDAEI